MAQHRPEVGEEAVPRGGTPSRPPELRPVGLSRRDDDPKGAIWRRIGTASVTGYFSNSIAERVHQDRPRSSNPSLPSPSERICVGLSFRYAMNHNCDARRLGINSHGRWAEREVAARMRKTGNVALCQRVGIDRRSDHRDRAGCSNGGLDKLILAADEEHVDRFRAISPTAAAKRSRSLLWT